jgi:hypothetical protein
LSLLRRACLRPAAIIVALLLTALPAAAAQRILFVGNSFTFGAGSAVRFFHPELVHDLNREGQGGVPALFKMFAQQAGLDWDVSLETAGGQDLAFHLANKKSELAGAWDTVLLQDYSTLDRAKPGNASAHIRDTGRMAAFFRTANPGVKIYLETTWPRADQTYPANGHWHGKPIKAMADDLARANALALLNNRELSGTAPVGEAWLRAFDQNVADPNPYDGVAYGKLDLWTWDHYHASAYGYYLAALVIFGRVTGTDPRALGERERAAEELGFSGLTTAALQRIAAEALVGKPDAGAAPRTGNR